MPPIVIAWVKKLLLRKLRGFMWNWLKKRILIWMADTVIDFAYRFMYWLASLTDTELDDTAVRKLDTPEMRQMAKKEISSLID